jgi:hypothetical protein
MKMNPKQVAYREESIRKFADAKRAKADSSLFCEYCGKPGDCNDPAGAFSAVIPSLGEVLERPTDPKASFPIFDDIRCFWVCPICVNKNKNAAGGKGRAKG